MSVALWLPLLTTLIAALAGAVVYVVQKVADRKNDLITKRRSAYESYLFAYLNTFTDSGLDPVTQRLELNKARMTIRLIGSDTVVKAVSALDQYAIDTSVETGVTRDGREFKRLMSAVVLSMRSDVFETTQMSLDEMKSSLPIRDA